MKKMFLKKEQNNQKENCKLRKRNIKNKRLKMKKKQRDLKVSIKI